MRISNNALYKKVSERFFSWNEFLGQNAENVNIVDKSGKLKYFWQIYLTFTFRIKLAKK